MLALGIETSCDETGIALYDSEAGVLGEALHSQVDLHALYGGVVPELASRDHIRRIVPLAREALAQAGRGLGDIDLIAYTEGPGLAGALLVGASVAAGLGIALSRPVVGIHHLEGHLLSPLLADPRPEFPFVALLVSGGHTCLVLVESFGRYRLLGASRDDAAGEAFDKVAKLLRLGYPGGPIVEEVARGGDPRAVHLPRALPGRDELDFSFSGLKTAVANFVRQTGVPRGNELADLCASFQQAVAEVLVRKSCQAVRRTRADALVAGGGVLANRAIRSALAAAAQEEGFALHVPPLHLCTDNAAMIAAAGHRRLLAGERGGLDLSVAPRLPL